MGTVTFDTDVRKNVDITKTVQLFVEKDVISSVELAGSLATAEASADALGSFFIRPGEDGFLLVDAVGDLSRDEIHEEWWDRALNFPTGNLSFAETDGALQGIGQDVSGVFLVDGFGDGEVTRSFTVPLGDTLAFPLRNSFFLATDPAEDPVQEAADLFDDILPDSLFLTVDGEDVPLDDLLDTRAATGLFDVTVEPGGFLDNFFDPGDTFDSAADGYFVLLDGLAPGPHTIVFGGATEDGDMTEVTAEILVLEAEGTLAEVDTFTQVSSTGAFAFAESLSALSVAEPDGLLI